MGRALSEAVMAPHKYHFITHWQMQAHKDEVLAIFNDAASLPRWWPAIYLNVRMLAPGDKHGIGKRVALHTKGWFPYTLRRNFVVTDVSPDGSTLVAEGDFSGRGIWTFVQNGEWLGNGPWWAKPGARIAQAGRRGRSAGATPADANRRYPVAHPRSGPPSQGELVRLRFEFRQAERLPQ